MPCAECLFPKLHFPVLVKMANAVGPRQLQPKQDFTALCNLYLFLFHVYICVPTCACVVCLVQENRKEVKSVSLFLCDFWERSLGPLVL